jgi:hypothetical protein
MKMCLEVHSYSTLKDGRTDGHDKGQSHFCRFAKAPKMMSESRTAVTV